MSSSYISMHKNSSLASVGQITDENDDLTEKLLSSNMSLDQNQTTNHERPCALTQMLLAYAQQSTSEQKLNNIFNVLEIHFNSYANDQQLIYFEGIFQILHDFKEQITEFVLIETMKALQTDPLSACTFEDFILILCHLPSIKQDPHVFLNIFNELDHDKDLFITFDDIQFVLPNLCSHLDEEIIRIAIRAIDADHDDDRLSYFDFVTSLLALEECKSIMKTKTIVNDTLGLNVE